MKTFAEMRNRRPQGETVWSKKFKRIKTEVQKTSKGFVAVIDGDVLDTFRTERDAVKSIETAIKELV